ncbi:MAG: sugar phosphate isomerase/epimerase [Planctomycetes bacterium]|nr:sugar phosphate isomerase/epimerase [Planctomycetota bacterium]
MKYAFMTFSCPQATLREALALAKRFGYDGIEPRIASGHRHGIELDTPAGERAAAAREAADAGVALCCVATSCRYADPALTTVMLDETRRAVDLAADVGAPAIRVFGGKLGEGLSRDDAIDLLAESLASVADHAAQRGVTLCVETHDDWCDPAHLVAALEKVDHPAVMANWDIMHPVRFAGVAMAEAFETIKPWIRHVHFHDGAPEGKGYPLKPVGTGQIDHAQAVRLLATLDVQPYLSGEWINWDEPCEIYLPRELATMRSYESR